jgi:uncharacterized protein involved in response to NO
VSVAGSFATPPGIEPARAGPTRAAGVTWPEPYRVLFPLGALFALAGAAPWLLLVAGVAPWPGPIHMALMIEGFEQSFVLGFLLTSMPAFTRGGRCRPWELLGAAGLLAAVAAFLLAGLAWAAHAAFALSVLLVGWALASRVVRARHLPPEEFLFVALGLLLGLAGAAALVAQHAAAWIPPAPRFGERLVSLGMMLSIVLGVGGLLVPTFTGMRDPLQVPGIARPHERAGRRRLFLAVALVLAGAFALEARGLAWAGSLARALGASALLLLVWKLHRGPGQKGLLPRVLWLAGWSVLAGLWLAVAWPAQATTAWHVVLIGGFGLLTLGIGTRVTVAHGRHPFADEARVLTPWIVGAVALALALRLAAALAPAGANHAHAASAAAWMLAWALWSARAWPRAARVAAPGGGQPVVKIPVSRGPGGPTRG